MTLTARQVSVSTSAAVEITDGTGATNNQSYTLAVKNIDTENPVYLAGANTASSTTGYKLDAGESIGIDLAFGEKVWGRATGSAVTVTVLQSKF